MKRITEGRIQGLRETGPQTVKAACLGSKFLDPIWMV